MSTVVEYRAVQLKINRLNSNGEDISTQISQANKIRIKHSDGIIEYPIVSRNQVANYWVLDLNMPLNTTGSDSTNVPVSIEPAFTADFQASDYNVLENNADQARVYGNKQVVDYNGASEDPINIFAIVTNTAEKAAVQEFNYTSKGSTSGKYTGKQLQGSAINEYVTGDISFGSDPVLERRSTLIFETERGQSTSPEMLGGGALAFTNVLNVGKNKDDVENYFKNTRAYDATLEQGVSVGDKFTLTQYNTDIDIPKILEVTATDIKVPNRSLYMVPSNYGSTVASWYLNSQYILSFASSVTIPQVEVVQQDPRIYSASILEDSVTEAYSTLQQELDEGNRLFMSFYKTLYSPFVYTGPDKIDNYSFISGSNPDGTLIAPLRYYGVIEIESVAIVSGDLRVTLNQPRGNATYDEGIANGEVAGQDFGILIWASSEPSVIIKNSELRGIQKAAFTSRLSTPVIEDNLRYITRNYGNNT